jgi:hypothetical protein
VNTPLTDARLAEIEQSIRMALRAYGDEPFAKDADIDLDYLLAEMERLEQELRHYRDHSPAKTIPFSRCEADVCVDAREARAGVSE